MPFGPPRAAEICISRELELVHLQRGTYESRKVKTRTILFFAKEPLEAIPSCIQPLVDGLVKGKTSLSFSPSISAGLLFVVGNVAREALPVDFLTGTAGAACAAKLVGQATEPSRATAAILRSALHFATAFRGGSIPSIRARPI
jgi:hypothetical protein